ncbi:MAG TPA: amidohydrolase family protein [Streptosporangiaceae bacterium]|nr:amidohydrolase family protein [Streptosporangiaceae bacterium]
MSYQLILKNGHVLDPGQGIDRRADIGITGGRISAIEDHIPDGNGAQVLDVSGDGRYVVPGLVDLHTHVARGGTTPGVGMGCCDADEIGIRSGVTTVLDAGSVGIANAGVFPAYILPGARTRVLFYLNVGTFAHSTKDHSDVRGMDDIDADGIASCIESNPGVVSGMKLRLVGPFVAKAGEQVIDAATDAARRAGLPLMVHIGDLFAAQDPDLDRRMLAVTEYLIGELAAGDILTHLCTPSVGGVGRSGGQLDPLLKAARDRGVVLDSALGMGNFGYQVAREQYDRGLLPDTISSDLTLGGQSFHSLMECMAKFMAIGYSLADVVRMTTVNAAAATGLTDTAGALAVGRTADITILDVAEGDFRFTDTRKETFSGRYGITPVQTVRAGELVAPRWGTHPWGWLPASASAGTAAS